MLCKLRARGRFFVSATFRARSARAKKVVLLLSLCALCGLGYPQAEQQVCARATLRIRKSANSINQKQNNSQPQFVVTLLSRARARYMRRLRLTPSCVRVCTQRTPLTRTSLCASKLVSRRRRTKANHAHTESPQSRANSSPHRQGSYAGRRCAGQTSGHALQNTSA